MKSSAPATRERLSREILASSALHLADSEGLDAVTIRRLASEHSVTPMALYWHFKDKDAVLDGIAEQIYAAVVHPEPTEEPWNDQLRRVLEALLAAIRPHPLAAELLAPRIMTTPAGLLLAERVIGMLRGAGFSSQQATQTASFLLHSMVTLVTSEPGKQTTLTREAQEADDRGKRAQLAALPPNLFPNLLASTPYFLECDDSDEYFRRGLDFLVAGTVGTLPS
jgi:AcrR family transcriptional regulator